jgi:hypothetical protein
MYRRVSATMITVTLFLERTTQQTHKEAGGRTTFFFFDEDILCSSICYPRIFSKLSVLLLLLLLFVLLDRNNELGGDRPKV